LQRIPNVPTLKPDETLHSYILRLAAANGFLDKNGSIDLKGFSQHYIYPNDRLSKGVRYGIPAHGFFSMRYLWPALGVPGNLHDFVCTTTILPVIALLSNNGYVDKIVYSMNPLVGFSVNQLFSNIINYCPICMKEDGYYRRAHQIPGVTICYKHGVPLCQVPERLKKCFATQNSLPYKEHLVDASEYAAFSKQLLDMKLDISFNTLFGFVENEIKKKELELPSKIPWKSGHSFTVSDIYTHENSLMARKLYYLFYLFKNHLDIGVLYHLKENAIHLPDGLTTTCSSKGIMMSVRHDLCGTEYLTTKALLDMHIGCPACDSRPGDIIFYEAFSAAYHHRQLESEYKPDIKMMSKCLACGRTVEKTPVDYLFARAACRCRNVYTKTWLEDELKDQIDSDLVSFTSMDQPFEVKCRRCGETRVLKMTTRWSSCKCRRREQIIITKNQVLKKKNGEDKNLIPYKGANRLLALSDEYQIFGIDPESKKIRIQHTLCGNIYDIPPNNFSKGRRCQCCNINIDEASFQQIVIELSHSQYIAKLSSKRPYYEVRSANGERKLLHKSKILQELTRPTDSQCLPVASRPNFLFISEGQKQEIDLAVLAHVSVVKVTTLAEINLPGLSKYAIYKSLQRLRAAGSIKYNAPYVYLPSVGVKDFIEKKYIYDGIHHVGYYCGRSFEQELGLAQNDGIWHIAVDNGIQTQQEILSFGERISKRPALCHLTDNNYYIVALADYITTSKSLDSTKKAALQKYIRTYNISFEDLQPMLGEKKLMAEELFGIIHDIDYISKHICNEYLYDKKGARIGYFYGPSFEVIIGIREHCARVYVTSNQYVFKNVPSLKQKNLTKIFIKDPFDVVSDENYCTLALVDYCSSHRMTESRVKALQQYIKDNNITYEQVVPYIGSKGLSKEKLENLWE